MGLEIIRPTSLCHRTRLGRLRSTDVNGNVTTVTTDLERATATLTATTTTSGVSVARIETKISGVTVAIRGHDNLTTRTGYDTLLRPVTRRDSRLSAGVNNTTTTAYVPGSTLVHEITDATATIVTQNTYDSLGRVVAQAGAPDFAVSSSAPPRHTTYSSYNLRGQLERQWGDAALPTSYSYDATYGERLTMSTYRGGSGWSNPNWPAASTDTADTTTWAYDPPTGLLAAKTDAAGAAVHYLYTSRGQLARRTWARGVTTDYTYDSDTAEQRDIVYSDATPSLHYTYNRLAQTTQIDDATGSHLLAHCLCGKLVSERFDPFFYGNRLLTYALNTNPALGPVGRTSGFTLKTASALAEETVAYGYDASARLHQVTASTSGVTAAGHTFNYGYKSDSNLIEQLAVDSGITFLVSRDFEEQRDVLTAIDSKWSTGTGASRARFVYITDALGQRASVKQSGSAFADYYETGTADSGTLQEFLYDARGQLTKAPTYLGVAPTPGQKLPNRQHEFTYDNIGNRASSNSTSDALADTYTTNALNQYTARDNKRVYVSGTADAGAKVVVTQPTTTLTATLEPKNPLGRYWSDRLAVPNSGAPWRGPLSIYTGKTGAGLSGSDLVRLETRMAQIAADPQTMTYDLDGNLTHDGIWSYTWDAENRLVQLTTVAAPSTGYAQITLKFRYDYLGRRVEKLVTDSASNQLLTGRRYLYDGWNLIAEYSLNSATLALTLLRSYTWGLDIARSLSDAGGVGALLQIADHTSGKTFYPCYDGNGNVVALVNSATGAVGAAFEYSPYGEILRADAPDPAAGDQPFRFSTKFTDFETGLVYYGKRYYSPIQGRFLGRDSIEERGGRNLYAFCLNNSVNRWDLLGKLPEGLLKIVRAEPAVQLERFVVNESRGGGGGYTFSDYSGGRSDSTSGSGEGGGGGIDKSALDQSLAATIALATGCTALQNAMGNLSKAIAAYTDPNVTPPSGASDAALKLLGATDKMIEAMHNAHATVFINSGGGATIAFEGTVPSSIADLGVDVANAFNLSTGRYDAAVQFATGFRDTVAPNLTGPVDLTGHSLGGGLAGAAALATGYQATTFNSSGIASSYQTSTSNASSLITNYHTLDPFVTQGQKLTPAGGALGTQVYVPGAGPVPGGHSSAEVMAGLRAEYQKKGC